MQDTDTIVAIATAAGAAGIGVVRLSGPDALDIAQAICGRALAPRRTNRVRFLDAARDTVDDGIALCFVAPASYTGEHVAELQAHGSPAVLQQLVARACALGARHARAGEFSQRAYLNGKLDLAQAEALADLIAAGDVRAARAARRALDGEFSRRVEALGATVLRVRVHVEAAIDFADESLDTLGGAALRADMDHAQVALAALLQAAEHGRTLRDGLHAVIVGPPNAGKSSLLNALVGSERAIVTEIAGTTRDLLHETIHVDGVQLTLVDSAGLRSGGDAVEREGMRRARMELQRADLALVVLDARDPDAGMAAVQAAIDGVPRRMIVHNKIDLVAAPRAMEAGVVRVSALSGEGMQAMHAALRAFALWPGQAGTGAFTARARHVDALQRSGQALAAARAHVQQGDLDLAAEALRQAHDALGEITGRLLPDALLGHIFSTFCIGK